MGNFHGQGTYESSSGITCVGYWDRNLKTGYGLWLDPRKSNEQTVAVYATDSSWPDALPAISASLSSILNSSSSMLSSAFNASGSPNISTPLLFSSPPTSLLSSAPRSRVGTIQPPMPNNFTLSPRSLIPSTLPPPPAHSSGAPDTPSSPPPKPAPCARPPRPLSYSPSDRPPRPLGYSPRAPIISSATIAPKAEEPIGWKFLNGAIKRDDEWKIWDPTMYAFPLLALILQNFWCSRLESSWSTIRPARLQKR